MLCLHLTTKSKENPGCTSWIGRKLFFSCHGIKVTMKHIWRVNLIWYDMQNNLLARSSFKKEYVHFKNKSHKIFWFTDLWALQNKCKLWKLRNIFKKHTLHAIWCVIQCNLFNDSLFPSNATFNWQRSSTFAKRTAFISRYQKVLLTNVPSKNEILHPI